MNLLVVSTVGCILECVMPIVIKYIISCLYSITKQDIEFRNELINLKKQMVGISMVDEFSKYTKLQRKYNKLESTLKEKANERLSSRMKIQFFIICSFRMLNGLFMLILLYLYRSKPVIIFPKGMLWPLQSFLSWPCYHEDSISLPMWLAITKLVVSMCKQINIT